MKKIFSKFYLALILIFFYLPILCFFIHNGFHKAAFLKKMNAFGSLGEKCFWHPRILPSEPEKVFIGNNVAIATDVYFCTHDINHIVLNNCERLEKSGGYKWKTGDIHIKDKEKELERSLGLPITLRYHKNHSGTIQIHFSTEEDFNRIINKLI